MTTRLNTEFSLDDPGDVLAALPHMLGFHPSSSFVVLTLRDLTETPKFGMSLRADLPCPSQACGFGEFLLEGPVGARRPEGVIIVVIGDAPDPAGCPPNCGGECREIAGPGSGPPMRDLVDVVRKTLLGAGIVTAHALHVSELAAGEPWQCYYDEDCLGVVADPRESPMGALLASRGTVTFGSREEVRALVEPESEEAINRWSAKLDALADEAVESYDSSRLARDVRKVHGAIQRIAKGSALTEDDLLGVLLAVADIRVRDIMMGTALSPELARPAEELWLTLVRKAPEPELPEVAALLAFAAYVRGDGVLAAAALERIERAQPEHTLGRLLRHALDVGIPPTELGTIANTSVDDIQLLLDEDGGC